MFVLNSNLIKALERAGLVVEKICQGQSYESMRKHGVKKIEDLLPEDFASPRYRVVKGEKILTWSIQGDKALNVHCTVLDDGRDSMRDYFPGHFAHRIKDAVEYFKDA